MTHHGHDFHDDPSLAGFWSNLKGWRLFLTMRNAQHYTYTDLAAGQTLTASRWAGRTSEDRTTALEEDAPPLGSTSGIAPDGVDRGSLDTPKHDRRTSPLLARTGHYGRIAAASQRISSMQS
jgi:hypothetical protein